MAIINELIKNPNIIQKELASIIGKSERTIKTRTVESRKRDLSVEKMENEMVSGKFLSNYKNDLDRFCEKLTLWRYEK